MALKVTQKMRPCKVSLISIAYFLYLESIFFSGCQLFNTNAASIVGELLFVEGFLKAEG